MIEHRRFASLGAADHGWLNARHHSPSQAVTTLRADARVAAAPFRGGDAAGYLLGRDRRARLVPAPGAIEIHGTRINAGDGASISDESVVRVTAIEGSEIVLVDAA